MTDAADRGRRNRSRGARAEVQVVNYLRKNGWPDARRYLSGDSRQPGDIDFAPGVCIEVRDRAQSAWPTWRAQTLAEAGDRIPIVVRRTRGVTDVGLWEAQLTYGGWWDLVDHQHGPADIWCNRTLMRWVPLPFADVVALLAVDH